MGPGINLNQDEWERQREERRHEREFEREREQERQERAYGARHPAPGGDLPRRRSIDESNMRYADSGTPGSAGGSAGRGEGEPPFRASPRPAFAGNTLDEADVGGSSSSRAPYPEDSRSPPSASHEPRKRPRMDMDIDGGDHAPPQQAPSRSYSAEESERGGKRALTESEGGDSRSRSGEAQDEEAMEAD
jgi:hypothetical protein